MGVWKEFNNNPCGRIVGDCAVRAISVALDVDWETAYVMITANGFQMCDMPSSDAVWGSVLRQHGFHRSSIPDSCPDCYTAEDFALEHADDGIYVLGFGGHVACIKGGQLWDSWDSSKQSPQFVWFRKDDDNARV